MEKDRVANRLKLLDFWVRTRRKRGKWTSYSRSWVFKRQISVIAIKFSSVRLTMWPYATTSTSRSWERRVQSVARSILRSMLASWRRIWIVVLDNTDIMILWYKLILIVGIIRHSTTTYLHRSALSYAWSSIYRMYALLTPFCRILRLLWISLLLRFRLRWATRGSCRFVSLVFLGRIFCRRNLWNRDALGLRPLKFLIRAVFAASF